MSARLWPLASRTSAQWIDRTFELAGDELSMTQLTWALGRVPCHDVKSFMCPGTILDSASIRRISKCSSGSIAWDFTWTSQPCGRSIRGFRLLNISCRASEARKGRRTLNCLLINQYSEDHRQKFPC
jgi:hypothetical protein